MGSRWDQEPDDLPSFARAPGAEPALPPRWTEAARALGESVTTDPFPRPAVARTNACRDFRTGPRSDGVPAAVLHGLRWLDPEVRDEGPSQGALLLGETFQTLYENLFHVDRVFLPEETVAFTLGATISGLLGLASPKDSAIRTLAIAATMTPSRRAVLEAWGRRLGLRTQTVPDPSDLGTDVAALVVETPNRFGLLENLAAWRAALGATRPLVVASMDPLSFFAVEAPVGAQADVIVFDVAALAAGGDEAAAVGSSARHATSLRGLFVRNVGDVRELLQSDGGPAGDEPLWTPVFAAALLAAELGAAGFRRRARSVVQRRRWIETTLGRRGIAATTPVGQRFREARFEVPRWPERRDTALQEGFRLESDEESGSALVRCPLKARRFDVTRLAEVLAGG